MSDETKTSETPPPPDPERIAKMRAALRENFGKVVMAMMVMPRYRSQHVSDLQASVLDPMLRDRVVIAYPAQEDGAPPADMAGFALWASVSEEVDQRIREQIKAGTWPLRLRPEDWTSGDIHWLLDVVATDREMAAKVIGNFGKLIGGEQLRLHPIITRLVEPEVLEKLGMRRDKAPEAAPAEASETPPAEGAAEDIPTPPTRH